MVPRVANALRVGKGFTALAALLVGIAGVTDVAAAPAASGVPLPRMLVLELGATLAVGTDGLVLVVTAESEDSPTPLVRTCGWPVLRGALPPELVTALLAAPADVAPYAGRRCDRDDGPDAFPKKCSVCGTGSRLGQNSRVPSSQSSSQSTSAGASGSNKAAKPSAVVASMSSSAAASVSRKPPGSNR